MPLHPVEIMAVVLVWLTVAWRAREYWAARLVASERSPERVMRPMRPE